METEDKLNPISRASDLPQCERCDSAVANAGDDSACSHCGMRETCEQAATQDSMRAADELGSTKMSLFSLLVFVFPLLGAVVGAVLGSRYGTNGEVVGGILGFAVFVLLASLIVRFLARKEPRTATK